MENSAHSNPVQPGPGLTNSYQDNQAHTLCHVMDGNHLPTLRQVEEVRHN